MGRLLVALAVMGGLVGCGSTTSAPVTQSCPTLNNPQVKYLCWLQTYGFNVTDESRPSLVVAGTTLCQGLHNGGSADEGVAVLYRSIPDITEKQPGNLIAAAQLGLCPDTLGQ